MSEDGVKASIYDIYGRELIHFKVMDLSSQIDISELPDGILTIQFVYRNGSTAVRKILKVNK